MKDIIRDKKFLLIMLCIFILTFISLLTYFFNKKEIEHKADITRLSTFYNQNKKESIKDLVTDMQDKTKNETSDTDANTLDISDDKVIEKMFIDNSKLINNNEFAKMYGYYNKNYIEDFKVREEQLKDKFKFSANISAKVTNIKRDKGVPDRVVVTVRFIDNKQAERIFDFTVFRDGTIADLPLFKEIPLDKVTEKDEITYTLKKKFITRLGSIFIVNINNHSEYLLDIQDIKGTMGTSFEYNHKLINGNKYTYQVTPKKNVDLVIKIENQEKPDDIVFTNKRYDGTIEKFSIWNKK